MYILTPKRLGQATQFLNEMNTGLYSGTSRGLGQAVLQKFGPIATQNGQPFELTDEQLKVVFKAALKHPPGQETYFYIYYDSSNPQTSFEFGSLRGAAPEVRGQADFNWDAAEDEADKMSRKAARKAKGNPAPSYKPAGFGHSHPAVDAGKPSGTDLGALASIATATPFVTMVVSRKAGRRPGVKHELDASVIWRSAYAPVPGRSGKLKTPRLILPGPMDYASHQDAADTAHRISTDLVFRYFRGSVLVRENGTLSSEFVELP